MIIVQLDYRFETWPGMMPASLMFLPGRVPHAVQRMMDGAWMGVPKIVAYPEDWEPGQPWPEDVETTEDGLDITAARLCEHCGAPIPEYCVGQAAYVCDICGNGGERPSIAADSLVELASVVRRRGVGAVVGQ